MDLLNDNVKRLFFKYFRATIGSSMIMTIYSIVDTICVGQYEGSDGTAAIACFFPVYSLLFAFGLLYGIGGSVFMAQNRGAGNKKEGDKYFTSGLIAVAVTAVCAFILLNTVPDAILKFCGAEGRILELAKDYAYWITIFSPFFMIGQYLILFIRNDGSPMYTTVAAVVGGVFNVFGDIYFVFGLDMGIKGAGLATAIGEIITFCVLISYFFRAKCNLRLPVRELGFFRKLKRIVTMGSSNFLVDIAMGVLAVIFNKQIMVYLGTTALGIYGVVSSIATTVQTFGYAVGEAAQAVISVNYGAGKKERIAEAVKYAGATAFVIGLVCCFLGMVFPVPLVKMYIAATPEIIGMAPSIMRSYFIAFPFLVVNVFSAYYFQAVGKPVISMVISLLRGVVITGILLVVLPAVFGGSALWFAVPATEIIIFAYVIFRRKVVKLNDQKN